MDIQFLYIYDIWLMTCKIMFKSIYYMVNLDHVKKVLICGLSVVELILILTVNWINHILNWTNHNLNVINLSIRCARKYECLNIIIHYSFKIDMKLYNMFV